MFIRHTHIRVYIYMHLCICTNTHIRDLRVAAALRYVTLHAELLREMLSCRDALLEVAWDESDQQTQIGRDIGVLSMMIIHFLLWTCSDVGEVAQHEVVGIPAFLKDTIAATQVNAVRLCLPLPHSELKQKVGALISH